MGIPSRSRGEQNGWRARACRKQETTARPTKEPGAREIRESRVLGVRKETRACRKIHGAAIRELDRASSREQGELETAKPGAWRWAVRHNELSREMKSGCAQD
jgi:hypothetical protein